MKNLPFRLVIALAASVAHAFVATIPGHSRESITTTTAYSSSSRLSMSVTLDGVEFENASEVIPTNNAVWVQVRDTLVATSGGILLPDSAKERPTEGTVVAAGPGKRHPFTGVLITNPVKPGMSVVYGQYDGKRVELNGRDCQIIRDDNVLLTYEGVTMRLETVTPVRDYVLVELAKESLTTESGVVVANQVLKDYAPCQGRVVKVGEGRLAANGELSKSPVAVGDFVKFKDYAGNEIEIEGTTFSVVKMVDILCTLVEDEEGDDEAATTEEHAP